MSEDKNGVMFCRKRLWFMVIVLCFFFFEAWPCMGQSVEVIYVDIDATGVSRNGTSWEEAFTSLDVALKKASADVALSADLNCEIWVASGDYKPTDGNSRDESFHMHNRVALYGGFAGGENRIEDRDISTNITILSGNISDDATSADNSYHVVYSENLDSSAILDGFTITGGNASGSGNSDSGGGMYNDSSDLTVINCTFRENYANWDGGGMYNKDSDPTVTSCDFSENSAVVHGGGMHNGYSSKPEVTDCTFSENSSGSGGGMCNAGSGPTVTKCTFSDNSANFYGGGMCNNGSSRPEVTDCTFSENVASNDGGGMYNDNSAPMVTSCDFSENIASDDGGGMYNNNNSTSEMTDCTFSVNIASNDGGGMYNHWSNPTVRNCTFSENMAISSGGGIFNATNSSSEVTNCTFSGNSAENGGGMFNYQSNPTVINCTFSENSASSDADGMYTDVGNITVKNCIFWDNSSDEINRDIFNLSYCVIRSSDITTDNITSADPHLLPLDYYGGPTKTYALSFDSSATNAGLLANRASRDQRGVSRPQGGSYDIGAYEAEFFKLTITKDGTGKGKVSPDFGEHLCFEKTEVMLSADADIRSNFDGWSGGVNSSDNFVTVIMNKDISVVAEFNLEFIPTPGPGPIPTPDPDPDPAPDPDPVPEPVPESFPSVPDRSDALDAILDGTVSLDLPEGMTGLSFDSFSSADIDLSSKVEPIMLSDISGDVLSEDQEGNFITGISFDITAKTSPDLGKTGILPMNVTLSISGDKLSVASPDVETLLDGVDIFKIISRDVYDLMDIARETGSPLGDFFSVTEDEYGDFHVSFGLLIVDAPAGDKPSVQAVTTNGDCRFLIFDGKTDGRFTDPIVAMENPNDDDNVDNNGSGGCSATAFLPAMVLLLVPLIFFNKRR